MPRGSARQPAWLQSLLLQPAREQAFFAVKLLTQHPSTPSGVPTSANEGIKLWDFIVEHAADLDNESIRQYLDRCDWGTSQRTLDYLLALSKPSPSTSTRTSSKARDASSAGCSSDRHRRKDMLRLFYSWGAWPWDLVDCVQSQQFWSRDLLTSLVALNAKKCTVQQAKTYLTRAIKYRLEHPSTGRRAIQELTISDVKRAIESFVLRNPIGDHAAGELDDEAQGHGHRDAAEFGSAKAVRDGSQEQGQGEEESRVSDWVAIRRRPPTKKGLPSPSLSPPPHPLPSGHDLQLRLSCIQEQCEAESQPPATPKSDDIQEDTSSSASEAEPGCDTELQVDVPSDLLDDDQTSQHLSNSEFCPDQSPCSSRSEEDISIEIGRRIDLEISQGLCLDESSASAEDSMLHHYPKSDLHQLGPSPDHSNSPSGSAQQERAMLPILVQPDVLDNRHRQGSQINNSSDPTHFIDTPLTSTSPTNIDVFCIPISADTVSSMDSRQIDEKLRTRMDEHRSNIRNAVRQMRYMLGAAASGLYADGTLAHTSLHARRDSVSQHRRALEASTLHIKELQDSLSRARANIAQIQTSHDRNQDRLKGYKNFMACYAHSDSAAGRDVSAAETDDAIALRKTLATLTEQDEQEKSDIARAKAEVDDLKAKAREAVRAKEKAEVHLTETWLEDRGPKGAKEWDEIEAIVRHLNAVMDDVIHHCDGERDGSGGDNSSGLFRKRKRTE